MAFSVVGKDQPVLLLHSSMSSHRQWQQLVTDLSADHLCIVPDLQGYGFPTTPVTVDSTGRNYQLADEAAVIVALLKELQIAEAVSVIGHSFGGALALHLAMTNAFAIKQLILFEPVAFHLLQSSDAECVPLLAEVQALATQLPMLSDQDGAQVFIDYWQQEAYFTRLPKRMQHHLAAQVGKVTLDFQALIAEPFVLADYQRLQMPVLLFSGRDSRRSAQKISELLQATIASAELRHVGTGHMGPVTHPTVVNPEIIRALRRGMA